MSSSFPHSSFGFGSGEDAFLFSPKPAGSGFQGEFSMEPTSMGGDFPMFLDEPMSFPPALFSSTTMPVAPKLEQPAPSTLPFPLDLARPQEVVPTPLSSPLSSDGSKKDRKSRKAPAKNRQERQEIRKIKHREIDRRRREREKQSVEELKELVALDTGERPEKANVVAGAVRQIKGLQAKIEELQAQLHRQHISSPQTSAASTPDTRASKSSPRSPMSFLDLDQKMMMGINTEKILLPDMIRGLGIGGVIVLCLSLEDCTIKNANTELENVTGFHKSDLLETKLTGAPLFGRILHSDMPASNMKHEHPLSSFESTTLQFKEAMHRLSTGATWKVTTQIKTREGNLIESQNTIFMVRNADDHTPAYLMCISTPDKRRIIPAYHARFPVNGALNEQYGSSFFPIAQPS
jgi:hypothetical protein